MFVHTRHRSQHGFDTDRDEHWSTRGACRTNPDAFTAPDSYHGQWRPKDALHKCRVHCPVRVECAEYAAAQTAGGRAGMVLGGVCYDSHGGISQYGNAAASSCATCRAEDRQPADEPSAHGTLAATRWHQEHGLPLCLACIKGEQRRERYRLNKRVQRERARLAGVESRKWTS